LENLFVDADLKNSRIAFRDILTIVPSLDRTSSFAENPDAVVYLDTRISGRLSSLSIPRLRMSGIGQTGVDVRGNFEVLPGAGQANYDLDIRELRSTARDINSLVPARTIPSNINRPESISVTGKVKGSQQHFAAKVNRKSSIGTAFVDGQMDRRVKNRETYNADVRLD